MQRRRIGDVFGAMPLAHQVTIAVAVATLGMAAFLFFRWVSTPSYTVLYTNLDDQTLSTVVDELDRQGVDYRIEGGGSRVLVPKSMVYELRGNLAVAGVEANSLPQGYELLDTQGLNVSDFRQRVDYQRALEGELARTLLAMKEITMAQVHLVIPDKPLFADDEETVTASVLLDSNRPLGELEVEAVTFVVSSAVEGLEPGNVTVADVDGQVLHAAGDLAAGAAVGNRNLRMTRDFELALANDVRNLLAAVVGANSASVVVRAHLDFDEESTESETYTPDSAIPLREQTVDEQFTGAGTPPGGSLGVDGEEIVVAADGDTYVYDRSEVVREYGVDRVISKSVTAPGQVEQLSVAVVMDDGTLSGAPVPAVGEIEELVGAAVGIDVSRGDSISVSTVAFPAPDTVALTEEAEPASAPLDVMSLLPQAAGGLVLLLTAAGMVLMGRSGKQKPVAVVAEAPGAFALTSGAEERRELLAVGAGSSSDGVQTDVLSMVQRQPEDVAALLRGWLADKR
jgi:flagellar M-ring protein FliF